MPTRQLVTRLIVHNSDYWGSESPYGKPLTDTRLGLLIGQATKVTSSPTRRNRPARVSPGDPGTGVAPARDRP